MAMNSIALFESAEVKDTVRKLMRRPFRSEAARLVGMGSRRLSGATAKCT